LNFEEILNEKCGKAINYTAFQYAFNLSL